MLSSYDWISVVVCAFILVAIGLFLRRRKQRDAMDLQKIANRIDELFGFKSNWTFDTGRICCQSGGVINININDIRTWLADAGLPESDLERLVTFIMAHEKGHDVQDHVWPTRDYGAETRVMELEADLIGAWALHKMFPTPPPAGFNAATRRFTDIQRMAHPVGNRLGKTDSTTSQEYPWPEQREFSMIRGEQLAVLYPEKEVQAGLNTFAKDVRDLAERHEFSL
jgi:hypothetical protein